MNLRSNSLAFGLALLSLVTVTCAPALAEVAPIKAAAGAGDVGQKNSVAINLTQKKVVKDASGAEKLIDAKQVKPGDIIEYRASYTNKDNQPVRQLMANLPIPEGLEYLPKSAKPGGAAVTAATKEGQFAPEPLMRKLPDGKNGPVPYAEYRALRWSVPQLNAGAMVVVSARAKVETVAQTAPMAGAAVAASQAPPAGRP